MKMKILEVGSYAVNCSIVTIDGLGTYVIDPGNDAPEIISALDAMGEIPSAILLTHAHFDHVSAISELQEKWPDLPVYIDMSDAPMFAHPFNMCPPEYPLTKRPANLRSVDELGAPWEVIHTPGHTPGGVCYYLAEEGIVFSGDTLFAGSVGRTDFPGGSMTKLINSLKALVALPEKTVVVPGHGPKTAIGAEKRSNPYIV